MMKKKNLLYYCIIAVLLVSVTLNLIISIKNLTPEPEKLFESSMHSVVEVKASTEEVGESFGSAVFVSNDGTLVTNSHVVTYKEFDEWYVFENISIRFAFENDYREVEYVKHNRDLDIAVLKLKDTDCNFKPIKFGDSKKIKSGNTVYAVGNLNNVGLSLTQGVVSNPSINVEYNEKVRNVIQCDLTIADGNSGGALLDKKGRLLGITTFRLKDSSQNVIYGIAYCVPANAVLEYIK